MVIPLGDCWTRPESEDGCPSYGDGGATATGWFDWWLQVVVPRYTTCWPLSRRGSEGTIWSATGARRGVGGLVVVDGTPSNRECVGGRCRSAPKPKVNLAYILGIER